MPKPMMGMFVTFDRTDRNLAVTLFFSLILTYSLFLQYAKNVNALSREAVALSIVQDGTLSIDRFQEFTIDKAYFHDRFYSDKAPGMALLAIPVVYTTRLLLKTLGRDGPVIEKAKLTHYYSLYVYVSTVLTSGLFTAAAAAAMFLTARGLGATPVGALFGALSYGVATPAFGWATAFFGHAMAGAGLLLAFAAVVALERGSPSPRHPLVLGCCVGGLLGLVMIVEFTTIPAAAVTALFALRVAMGLDRGKRWRVVVCAFICGAVMLTPLGLYNYIAFGSPMHIGYESVVGFAAMKQGFMGVGVPKFDVLGQILLGRYRGLFIVSPVLFFSLSSPLDTWRRGLLSSEHFIYIIAIATSFVLINSGYYFWDGGCSIGPRFLTPMIPFLCLPLALQWSTSGRVFRSILIMAFTISIAFSLATTSVGMIDCIDSKSPLTESIIPRFLSGDLSSAIFRAIGWPTWVVMFPLIVIWTFTALIQKRLLQGGAIGS